MAQEGFVDLYEVLNVPPEAETEALRARISQAYLEAQKNLDHRNAAKRLQFQQLYEVVLPQARHLLLDAARRAEYDRYLVAYRSGRPVAAQSENAQPAPQTSNVPQSTNASTLDVPNVTPSADVDPAQLATEREAMWDQWKSGLETPPAADSPPQPSDSPPQPSNSPVAPPVVVSQVPVAPAAPPMPASVAPAPIVNHATPRPVAKRSWGNKSAEATQQEEDKRREEELERSREGTRIEISRGQEQTAAVIWGFASAGAVFLVVFLFSLWLEAYFHSNNRYPMGLSRGSFTTLSFFFTVVLSALAGWFGAQKGRQSKASELSKLSYEQLLKRTQG